MNEPVFMLINHKIYTNFILYKVVFNLNANSVAYKCQSKRFLKKNLIYVLFHLVNMGKQIHTQTCLLLMHFPGCTSIRNVMVPHWNATGNISIGQATGRIIMK